tara:strand:- start:7523 stop:8755 length:1233 start_codon:yes stop_codon:yes gene_type:complete
MKPRSTKVAFEGSQGDMLAARLELPPGPPKAYAIFAHCFTCSKDVFAAARISAALAAQGIGVLRFDFTGLGMSGGDFANTNFSSNIQDLLRAVDFLRRDYEAPSILIGHSLGGAAVLAAAGDVPEAKAVATIGAPADAGHVVHAFHADLSAIEESGEAEVTLADRKFTIRKQFLDDVNDHTLEPRIGSLRKALLIFHAPLDQTVGIENAAQIFDAAKHPKSFISLDNADHLLSRHDDALYVAHVLSAWATRYIGTGENDAADDDIAANAVTVIETGQGKFQQRVASGHHRLLADEPESQGGFDSGPGPYDFLSIALGACTSMTLRLYAEHKGIELGRISVRVEHAKVHAKDCADCAEGRSGYIDRFERVIDIEGGFDPALSDKIIEIAGKCPVHRTLEKGAAVVTRLSAD